MALFRGNPWARSTLFGDKVLYGLGSVEPLIFAVLIVFGVWIFSGFCPVSGLDARGFLPSGMGRHRRAPFRTGKAFPIKRRGRVLGENRGPMTI